jgi:mRNA-degrading endonuclease toxin of MazEF toxin-antitoxin module
MAELKPEIGLVIRHAYLWWSEARQAREDGSKDRPCVIVHLRVNEHRELETYICPITHTPPAVLEKAIEIRAATKKRLHLDDQRSWVITTEINRFIWPGPDLRPVPGGGYSYGLLPGAMTRDLVAQVKANAQDRSLLVVSRTE